MKKILFVLNKPPYSGAYTHEMLDVAMTAAAFEQEVALLLLDDAVFNLIPGQNPESAGLKNTSLLFNALSLYDIEKVYVEDESLTNRGLVSISLIIPTIRIVRNQVAELYKQFDHILT